MNAFQQYAALGIDMFSNPHAAFVSVRKHDRSWWLPLLAILLVSSCFWAAYFSTVDTGWLAESALGALRHSLDRRTMSTISKAMTAPVLIIESIAGQLISLSLMVGAIAAYLKLAAQWGGHRGTGMVQWLALAAWSRVPELISYAAASLRMMLSAHTRVAADQFFITTMAAFLHAPPSHGISGFLVHYDLVGLWELLLLVIGYRAYVGVSARDAGAVVLAPWVALLLIRMVVIVL